MRVWLFLPVLLFLSCSSRKDKILVPRLEADFYDQTLERIDAQLQGDEGNMRLVEQKMYYCERLDWPETCIEAIEELKRQKGISSQLLDQYIIYYSKHGEYEKLLAVIDRWAKQFSSDRKYLKAKIEALTYVGRNEEAGILLRNYMANKTSYEDIAFAASQYVSIQDTLFSAYYLYKLYQIDSEHPLIYDHYGHLMVHFGYLDFGFSILEAYALDHPEDFGFHQELSSMYVDWELYEEARYALRNFTTIDTVAYTLSSLFLKQRMWDSAHYYIDVVLDRDSLSQNALSQKAKIYEERGWLSASLDQYNELIYHYPNDSVAKESAAQVRRKIAYLQRLKFERQRIPVPTIESIKLKNNQ